MSWRPVTPLQSAPVPSREIHSRLCAAYAQLFKTGQSLDSWPDGASRVEWQSQPLHRRGPREVAAVFGRSTAPSWVRALSSMHFVAFSARCIEDWSQHLRDVYELAYGHLVAPTWAAAVLCASCRWTWPGHEKPLTYIDVGQDIWPRDATWSRRVVISAEQPPT
jgi:hypothetical protein